MSDAKQNLGAFKEGFTTIQMDNNDLKALVILLSDTKDIFADQAMLALNPKSQLSMQEMINRSKLAGAFAQRFYDFLRAGEPENRDSH
jgi:hypothetical protein